jgi:hypothetical protein
MNHSKGSNKGEELKEVETTGQGLRVQPSGSAFSMTTQTQQLL